MIDMADVIAREEAVFALHKTGLTDREIGARFGISGGRINQIRRRRQRRLEGQARERAQQEWLADRAAEADLMRRPRYALAVLEAFVALRT